jgi:hypothetical protein
VILFRALCIQGETDTEGSINENGAIVFLPLSPSPIVFLPPFFNFVILPRDFKTKLQFTPVPLCDINGVKYNMKRQNCPYDFTPNVTLSL